MKEIWKDIKGYEGLYQISNLGRIKSLPKINGYKFQKELIRKNELGTNGYLIIVLNKNSKHHSYSIHRLVAQAFIPNPKDKPQVNHKDGNKLNNNVENLEWTTRSENQKHAYKLGLLKPYPLMPIKRMKKVNQYTLQGKLITNFNSIKEASKTTNISITSISQCCNNKQKTAGKYIWKFEGE